MKRKLISLFLTLTTVFACLSMAIVPGVADEATTTPEVWFGGHQRTVVADDSYGIRLVGLTNGLNVDEVGFDVAVIKNDGSMATFEQPITTVYTSITAYVEGKEETITAEGEGAEYIFTVVIDEIDPTQGFFWGYLCSTYYKVGGVKTSGETYKIVYNGAEECKDSYILNKTPVETTYLDFADGEGNKTTAYIHGNNVDGDEAILEKMWNGTHASSDYVSYYYDGTGVAGSWCSASFDQPTVIGKLKLSTAWNSHLNKLTQIQASVDGENWETLKEISVYDEGFIVESSASSSDRWALKYLEVSVTDTTAYNYIRVYDSDGSGYCFTEIEVFAMDKVVPSELTSASYYESDVEGTGAEFWGTSKDDSNMKHMWDGDLGTYTYVYTGGDSIGTAYSTAQFAEATKITKIKLTANRFHERNKGVKILASVDGQNWDDLYTISSADGDFVVTATWTDKSMEFAVPSDTAYNFIRVQDTSEDGGQGFILKEVQIYTQSYSEQFAEKLATTLPIIK